MKKRNNLYIIALATVIFIITSCSSFLNDLHVIPLKVGEVTYDSGTNTLTVTEETDLSDSALVLTQDGKTVQGEKSEEGTYSFDMTSVIDETTKGGTYGATLSSTNFASTTVTYEYEPEMKITSSTEIVYISNEGASTAEEPAVETNYKDDSIEVTVTYKDSDGNTLDNWSAVKDFMSKEENIGKSVTATYTATSTTASAKTATATKKFVCGTKANFGSVTAKCTEAQTAGSALSNTSLTAIAKDSTGADVADVTVTATFDSTDAITSSKYVSVTVHAEGYNDKTTTVFVPVKAAKPSGADAPALSTDVANITRGNVKFTAADDKYEYSTDGGVTWKTVTADEFAKPETLLVRSKETAGDPADENGNKVGYVAPSDSVAVAIDSTNTGTKQAGDVTVTVTVTYGDISIEQSGYPTVTLTAATGYTDYKWTIDGTSASSVTGVTVKGNVLTVDSSKLVPGVYQITVYGTKDGTIYSTVAQLNSLT